MHHARRSLALVATTVVSVALALPAATVAHGNTSRTGTTRTTGRAVAATRSLPATARRRRGAGSDCCREGVPSRRRARCRAGTEPAGGDRFRAAHLQRR